MSKWRAVTLGDVAQRVTEKNVDQDVKRVMTVSAAHGLIDQEKYFSKSVASKDLSTYYVIHPGDFVYNKSTSKDAEFGVVARLDSNERAVVTPLYIVFRANPDMVDPEFLLLACNGARFFASLSGLLREGARAHGLLNVRLSEFFSASVELPPVVEQRRIVAMMSAVDAQISDLEAEVSAARTVLDRTVSTMLGQLPATIKYGAVARTRSGPSWAAIDESKVAVDGGVRVVKITNTKSDGTLDMSDETYVVGLPESTATLTDSSLVIIRTNGNRNRIGNVYRPSSDTLGCAVSAFQFISQPADPAHRDFLYWTLREPLMQKQMTEAASGTTGLGNLAVRWLNAVEIPWTDDADKRAAITTTADATETAVTALAAELAALRRVRSDLLTALLSQDIAVDEAVDQFVEGAV
jgi:restriction endonuclease S subunit